MLNAYFERLVPLMERAGGEVHQIVGDELMVVFGKAGRTPDHARRAARAALLLQRAAAAGRAATTRIGRASASGSTAARFSPASLGGASGHRKHGIVGDVVNVAARLQAEAPVGGVLIGEETFRQLGVRRSRRGASRRRREGQGAAGPGIRAPRLRRSEA